jgi:hypothetical protein
VTAPRPIARRELKRPRPGIGRQIVQRGWRKIDAVEMALDRIEAVAGLRRYLSASAQAFAQWMTPETPSNPGIAARFMARCAACFRRLLIS